MMNITKRMKRSTKAALGLQLPFGKSKGLRSKDPKGRRVSALSPGKTDTTLVIEQFANWKMAHVNI